MKKIKVTVIGGGTGTYSVIRGLKIYPQLDLNIVVGMTDDGGSNRVVRDEFGLLPLSDLRKSIIALADESKNELLREMFMYRFSEGKSFEGHTLGNIMMIALSRIAGSETGAIEALSEVFDIKGKIYPVTLDKARLCADYSNGTNICGEHFIDDTKTAKDVKITKLYLSDSVKPNPKAIKSILNADFVIVGPGDLYTTTIANLIVDGVASALQKTKANLIFISNMMTKQGETHWMKQRDIIDEIVNYVGRVPDIILVNNSPYPKDALKRYRRQHEYPFVDNLSESQYEKAVLRSDFLSEEVFGNEKGDVLRRSFIRHDPYKLGYVLYGVMVGKKMVAN